MEAGHVSVLAEGLEQPALVGQSRVIKSIKPRGAANFPRSQLVTPVRTDEGMPQRRRLEGKQGHSMSMEACQDVLRELQNLVPRADKAEIQSTSVLQKL